MNIFNDGKAIIRLKKKGRYSSSSITWHRDYWWLLMFSQRFNFRELKMEGPIIRIKNKVAFFALSQLTKSKFWNYSKKENKVWSFNSHSKIVQIQESATDRIWYWKLKKRKTTFWKPWFSILQKEEFFQTRCIVVTYTFANTLTITISNLNLLMCRKLILQHVKF